ncbi:hypothetical protein BKA56DRAFT_734117 [Ilyonectria sp. MPI-CAGE-AT-0026]|nr:hypothetical protein BKA56DRAFT_734117 [Ilyonectria sp. MPI-CAGE-AT-0026]
MSTAWHELGLYFRISNTATLTIPRAKLVDGGRDAVSLAIRRAVAQVMLAQPVMRVGIVGENSKRPQFVAVSEVDLSKQVEESEAASMDDVASRLEKMLLQPWPQLGARPGWHVLILHDNSRIEEGKPDNGRELYRFRICFTVHHAICDGMSTAMFQKHLVDALNGPDPAVVSLMDEVCDRNKLIIKFPDADPGALVYPPPQEQLIKFTADLGWTASKVWGSLAPPMLKPWERPTWAGKPHDPIIKAIHVRYMALDSVTAEAIARRCRDEKTTVTNLVNALCATSLARRMPSDAVAKRLGFVASTPISLRPWITDGSGSGSGSDAGSSSGRMSVCVTGYDQEFPQHVLDKLHRDTDVWELAAQLRADMKQRTDTMPHNDVSGLATRVGDWRDVFRARFGKPRRELWSVSNLGRVAAPRRPGPWAMESLMFSQLYPVISCALAIGLASVDGGDLVMSFVWQDGILETPLVQGLRDDLEKWMVSLARNGELRVGP